MNSQKGDSGSHGQPQLLVRLLLFPLLLRLRLLTIAAPACVALQVGPQRIAQHRPCPPPRLHVAR